MGDGVSWASFETFLLERDSLATEVERLKGALREVAFAGCRHVWDDDCARCHTFEPLKSVARRALAGWEADEAYGLPVWRRGDGDSDDEYEPRAEVGAIAAKCRYFLVDGSMRLPNHVAIWMRELLAALSPSTDDQKGGE